MYTYECVWHIFVHCLFHSTDVRLFSLSISFPVCVCVCVCAKNSILYLLVSCNSSFLESILSYGPKGESIKRKAWQLVGRVGSWEISSQPYTGSREQVGVRLSVPSVSPRDAFPPARLRVPCTGSTTSLNHGTNVGPSVQIHEPLGDICPPNHLISSVYYFIYCLCSLKTSQMSGWMKENLATRVQVNNWAAAYTCGERKISFSSRATLGLCVKPSRTGLVFRGSSST